jgi:hypothetical protein
MASTKVVATGRDIWIGKAAALQHCAELGHYLNRDRLDAACARGEIAVRRPPRAHPLVRLGDVVAFVERSCETKGRAPR